MDGHLSSKECGVGAAIPEVQGMCCALRRYCEGWLRNLCSIYWTKLICVTNDGRKSNGCHRKAARLCWTGSWRKISLYPGKIGRCSKTAPNSKIRMSRFLDTPSKTQVAKIVRKYWRPRCSFWEKLIQRHTLAGLLWERQFEKVLLELRWEKVPNWECLFVHRKQQLFWSVFVDFFFNGWKEAEFGTQVEEIDEERWSSWTYIISWSRVFRVYSTWMQTNWNCYWEVLRNVRMTYVCWSNWKITRMGRKNCCVVIRYGRSCSKMRGKVSWIGE